MFERFTASCIKVLMLAQEEARRMGHDYVGTEQILLGLIGEGAGIAARTLKTFEINLKEARVEVQNIIGKGSGQCAVEIPFTSGAKRALEYSWDEARQLSVNYVGTEHLLLGVVRIEEDHAIAVLEKLGVSANAIKQSVIEMLNQVSEKPRNAPQLDAVFIVPPNGVDKRFDRFTEGALKVLKIAQEETRRTGRDDLGTEQILIGLIEEGGIAASALELQGMTSLKARQEIEKLVGVGEGLVAAEIPFTVKAKNLIDRAEDEAKRLGSNFIGSEHLLLGLLLAKGIGVVVLKNLHVDLGALRAKVLELIKIGGAAKA